MKITLTLIIGIIIGATVGATYSVIAEKAPQPAVADYDDGFRDGRTDGYHAAVRQMEGCFK